MSSDSSEDEDYDAVIRPVHIIYNWAMTGDPMQVEAFCKQINYEAIFFKEYTHVAVAPPVVYLERMRKYLKAKMAVIGQDCGHETEGAFTGCVSAKMLKDYECVGSIVGHWGRRQRCGETDDVVGLKVQRLTEKRIKAFVCVGETKEERLNGSTIEVIGKQIEALFDFQIDWRHVIFVYEPVWAVEGADEVHLEVHIPPKEKEDEDSNHNKVQLKSPPGDIEVMSASNADSEEEAEARGRLSPEDINTTLEQVRVWLSTAANKRIAWTTPILYGGPVDANSAVEMIKMKNVDGFLVHRTTDFGGRKVLDAKDDGTGGNNNGQAADMTLQQDAMFINLVKDVGTYLSNSEYGLAFGK